MKPLIRLFSFLLGSHLRLSVMGWDDLLMGLAMTAGETAIKKAIAGNNKQQNIPGQPTDMQQMDLNQLLAQARQGQGDNGVDRLHIRSDFY